MNSPDPDSESTPSSSGTPPLEETSPYVPSTGGSNYLSNLTSHITATFAGGPSPSSSKRRLPPGSSFGAASSKSRRRERGDPGRTGHSTWEKESGKKEPKDDLLDQALVEHLRKGMCPFARGVCYSIYRTHESSEIGDPFLEIGIKG